VSTMLQKNGLQTNASSGTGSLFVSFKYSVQLKVFVSFPSEENNNILYELNKIIN